MQVHHRWLAEGHSYLPALGLDQAGEGTPSPSYPLPLVFPSGIPCCLSASGIFPPPALTPHLAAGSIAASFSVYPHLGIPSPLPLPLPLLAHVPHVCGHDAR